MGTVTAKKTSTRKGVTKMEYTPMKHQVAFGKLWSSIHRVLNLDGCGTGKTMSCIHAVKEYWPNARVLVLAPLSILRSAWGGDLDKFWPETTWDIAYAKNRAKVFGNTEKQWVITNHDAVKTILQNSWHKDFDIFIVDEADVFRNRVTQRTRALITVAEFFEIVSLMTGTPTPRSVTDIWSLAYAIDGGQRLGKNFFAFRNQVCNAEPIPGVANAMKWTDKPQARSQVVGMLADVCTRVQLSDVVELPDTIVREIPVELPATLRRQYEEMKRESMLMLESGQFVNAIHAGARRQKLLQMLSGAVYSDTKGTYVDMHPDRSQLVIDLVLEADHSLVAFNWQHQRAGLEKAAKKEGIPYGVIDGSTPVAKREWLVSEFQAGRLQTLFCHPQSAGHGLTMTLAQRVIWASPTDRADLYEQFNHRMRRNGQKRKTEIIHVAAENTLEESVYDNMLGKKFRQDELLSLFSNLRQVA